MISNRLSTKPCKPKETAIAKKTSITATTFSSFDCQSSSVKLRVIYLISNGLLFLTVIL
jgi:hypothetical protein